ncbi:MAG: exodeoxyribonuclease VII large subunit [Oscillospiraceae bacterium]|nr:exodeoxyribonuclease VII large subunit [Oscillospiraceae bacterium]
MNEQTVFTVTELNSRVKMLLELDPALQSVCVAGEISNYKSYPSGHHYFTLKDAESSVRCVMFRSYASRLRFRPENGMSAAAFGRVGVYPRDGAYQLYCEALRPLGAGDLNIAYEQLKARLQAEGLFDAAAKKPIPRFPARIAVITSPAGAAVRDIIRVAGHRWPLAKLIILPVRVQGAEAPAEIAEALSYANRHAVADLIITGRGGGSIEDLWCFNDERVARAIYASKIPVISAVGHEPDVTIADYVADLRAATPSNGAELAVPDQAELREGLLDAEERINQALQKKLGTLRRELTALQSRGALKKPTAYIDQKRMDADRQRSRLIAAQEKRLGALRREQVRLAAALDALSPLRVLSRGYAVAAKPDGTVLRSAAEAERGEMIDLTLTDGALRCRVEDIFAEAKGGKTHGGKKADV